MYNSDLPTRVHQPRGDSWQNEAERTNSAIGDLIVDGSTINWEFHKQFEGLTEEEISSLSLQEYEQHKKDRMEKMHSR